MRIAVHTVASRLTGGAAGAAGALNEVQNNYLTPRENLARNKAAAACSGSNYTDSKSCGEANRLNTVDAKRDRDIAQAVQACRQAGAGSDACNNANNAVAKLQNQGMQELRDLAKELVPSCAAPKDCSQASNWKNSELASLDAARTQMWPYIASGAVQPTVGLEAVAAGGIVGAARISAGAFAVGAGLDAAGQLVQNGTVRPEQSLVAGGTAAASVQMLLRTPSQYLIYATPAIGAGASAINTTFNNIYYNESTNVWVAGGLGGLFGAAGPIVGAEVKRVTTPFITNAPRIPLTGPTYIPATPLRLPNVPSQVGNVVNNGVSNIPSFIPLDDGKSKQGGKP